APSGRSGRAEVRGRQGGRAEPGRARHGDGRPRSVMQVVVSERDHLADVLADLADVALEHILPAASEETDAGAPLVDERPYGLAVGPLDGAGDREGRSAGAEAHEVPHRTAALVEPNDPSAHDEISPGLASGGNDLRVVAALAQIGSDRVGVARPN